MNILLGLLVILVVIILAGKRFGKAAIKSGKQPATTMQVASNDKMVIIDSGDYDIVRMAVQQFCDKYRDDEHIEAVLTKLADDRFCVTFPYDISFDTLCHFVNYIRYPDNLEMNADIKAWVTPHDTGNKLYTGSKLMMYIPPTDTEYDNVHFVTEGNKAFVMSFANEIVRSINNDTTSYMPMPIAYSAIEGMPFETFK